MNDTTTTTIGATFPREHLMRLAALIITELGKDATRDYFDLEMYAVGETAGIEFLNNEAISTGLDVYATQI